MRVLKRMNLGGKGPAILMSAALLMTAPGLGCSGAAAAGMAAASAAGPAAWVPPYAPASAALLTGIQRLLDADAGKSLFPQEPSLGMLRQLKPSSEFHLRVLGAMAAHLPADFDSSLDSALNAGDAARLASLAQSVLAADRAAVPDVKAAVRSRAKDAAAGVVQGRMQAQDVAAAADELAAFAFYGDAVQVEIRAMEELARAARAERTMSAARRIARTLLADGALESAVQDVDASVRGKPGQSRHETGLAAPARGSKTPGSTDRRAGIDDLSRPQAGDQPGPSEWSAAARFLDGAFFGGYFQVKEFLQEHGEALRSIPGAASVQSKTFLTSPYTYDRGIEIQVKIDADMAEVKKALEAYRYAGFYIHVDYGDWWLYEITRVGYAFEHTSLDRRMAVENGKIGGGRSRAKAFAQEHGEALRSIPGVASVQAKKFLTSPYTSDWGVEIQVKIDADMAVVKKALEAYQYAGLDIHVDYGNWSLYEITRGGSVFEHQALDLRMAVANGKIGGGRSRAKAFVQERGSALRSIPGVANVQAKTLLTSPYTVDWGVEIQVKVDADMAAVKKALEAYRYAGLDIHVDYGRWSLYEITRGGAVFEHQALDPRMAVAVGMGLDAQLGSMQEAIDFIESHQSFLIVSHARPDGDAIGSTLGLADLLRKLGKTVYTYNADEVPEAFQHLSGSGDILHSPDKIPDVDAVIVVDCGDEKLFGPAIVPFLKGKPVLNLDHHMTNTGFGTARWRNPAAVAAGEMIVDLLRALDVRPDTALAESLYLAIYTDSGRFQYPVTSGNTLRNSAVLFDAGVRADDLPKRLDLQKSPEQVRILASILPTIEYNEDQSRADAVLSPEAQALAGQDSDVRDAILAALDHIRSVKTVRVAAVYSLRQDGRWEAELRGKGDVNVGKIAEQFDGGGHRDAAGCRLPLPLPEFRGRLRAAIEQALREGQAAE
jgi:phosphoesterase RecJ-like protein